MENPIGRLVMHIHLDEIIQIGDDVVLTFMKIKDNHVRICVEAPKELKVQRVRNKRFNASTDGPHRESSSSRKP